MWLTFAGRWQIGLPTFSIFSSLPNYWMTDHPFPPSSLNKPFLKRSWPVFLLQSINRQFSASVWISEWVFLGFLLLRNGMTSPSSWLFLVCFYSPSDSCPLPTPLPKKRKNETPENSYSLISLKEVLKSFYFSWKSLTKCQKRMKHKYFQQFAIAVILVNEMYLLTDFE